MQKRCPSLHLTSSAAAAKASLLGERGRSSPGGSDFFVREDKLDLVSQLHVHLGCIHLVRFPCVDRLERLVGVGEAELVCNAFPCDRVASYRERLVRIILILFALQYFSWKHRRMSGTLIVGKSFLSCGCACASYFARFSPSSGLVILK